MNAQTQNVDCHHEISKKKKKKTKKKKKDTQKTTESKKYTRKTKQNKTNKKKEEGAVCLHLQVHKKKKKKNETIGNDSKCSPTILFKKVEKQSIRLSHSPLLFPSGVVTWQCSFRELPQLLFHVWIYLLSFLSSVLLLFLIFDET